MWSGFGLDRVGSGLIGFDLVPGYVCPPGLNPGHSRLHHFLNTRGGVSELEFYNHSRKGSSRPRLSIRST